jgi:anti-sigma factor RsiW
MNDHLTHQELTDHLLGTRSATVEAHLAGCSACSKELYQFKESVESFRGAVHNWSEAGHAGRSKALPVPRSFDWLLVGAMAMVLATFAILFFGDRADTKQNVSLQQPTSANSVAENSAAQIQKDNELLSNINQELSEELPAPMQPLQVSASRQTTGESSSNE